MVTERITITLPKRLATRIRDQARRTNRPISRVIADDLQAQEQARLRAELIEAYKAIAADPETKRITEEWFEIAAETWPEE
jgi:hypothetical protein